MKMHRALILSAVVSLAAGALRRVSPLAGPADPCGAPDCEACHARTPAHALGFGLAPPPRACCWCKEAGPKKCFARDDPANPCKCDSPQDKCDGPPKPPKPPTKAPTTPKPKPPPTPRPTKPTPDPTATPTAPTARPTYPTPSPTAPTASPTKPTKRPTTAKPTKSPTPPPECTVPDVHDDGTWSGPGCSSKASVAMGTHCKLTVVQGAACGDMAEGTSRRFTCVRHDGPKGGAEWTPRVPKCKRTPPPTPPPTKRPTRPTAAPTDPTASPTDPTPSPTLTPTRKPTKPTASPTAPTARPTRPTPKPTPIPECVVPDVHKDGTWSGAKCESHAVVKLGTQCTLSVAQGSACGDMAEGTSRSFTCQIHNGPRNGWEWEPSIPHCKRTPPPTMSPTAPTARPTRPTASPTDPTATPTRPTARPTAPTASPTNPTSRPTRPTKSPTTPKPPPPTTCSVPDLGPAAEWRAGPPILSADCKVGHKVTLDGLCQVEVRKGYQCDGFVGPKPYDVRCVKGGPQGGVHWDKPLKCGKKKLLRKKRPIRLA